ncbi:hypothetical protein U9M48_001685 [Paspalum notatum var. saurae]|uniref:Reverse transcriptase domain-containing protein n=1 Tax=Paspalum notatum var. saurae TaxID=547442 RepID=A0AAQ3SGW8_PASNO
MAYDKVPWDFMQQVLRMTGFSPTIGVCFSPTWCNWIKAFKHGGNVGINVNDQSKKGLRQGDPLSPLQFNIVVDMLAILIHRAKDAGQIRGVIPRLVDDVLSILQYADDTVTFLDHDL